MRHSPVLIPAVPATALACLLLAAAVPAAAGTLAGSVVIEEDAAPAARTWVSVARVGDLLLATLAPQTAPRALRRMIRTDEHGRFTVEDLPSGLYEVAAVPESLPPAVAPARASTRAALATREDRATVELTLTRRATLQGRVLRRGAGPVVGARVEVFHHQDQTAIAETRSDDRGLFTVRDLEQGARVDLVVTGPEGLYRKLSALPLRAGATPVETDLPTWEGVSARRVQLLIAVPATLGQSLEMEWVSRPEDAREGFRRVVPLDRDARAELDSPVGIYLVRVRELEAGGRTWVAPRLVRVEPGAEPLSLRVEVELTP
jgi:hypothetical protein